MNWRKFGYAINGSMLGATAAAVLCAILAALSDPGMLQPDAHAPLRVAMGSAAQMFSLMMLTAMAMAGGMAIGVGLGLATAIVGKVVSRFTMHWRKAMLLTPGSAALGLVLFTGSTGYDTAIALVIAAGSAVGAYKMSGLDD